MNTEARDTLLDLYADWFTNYLTVEHYASVNGLTVAQAKALIDLAREVTNSPHPEA